MSAITPAPQSRTSPDLVDKNDVIDTKEDIAHVDEPVEDLKWDTIKSEAARGEAFEHDVTLWQAIKYHRKAVAWAAFISLTIIMEAYDGSMGGNFSLFEFRKSFGTPTGDGDYQVSAQWMGAIGVSPTIGQWIGIPWGTFCVDRLGYRWTFIGNLMLIIPVVAISVFAQSKTLILIGAMLQGIPFGAFQALTTAFCTEMVPLSLRPYSTGGTNFCWVFGGLIGSAVIQGTQGIKSSWCWRIPFMTQWVWPIPLSIGIFLAPESPWWLVRKQRYAEAEKVIKRIAAPQDADHSHETLAQMIRTTAFEREQAKAQNTGGWGELFRGVDRRRTEIGCMTWAAQNLCGSGFVAGTTYIMEQAGISQEAAFRFSFGGSVISVAGNLVAFYMFSKLGRRTILLWGLAILFFGLICIGGAAVAINEGHHTAMWVQASLQIIWNFFYVCFLGPPVYAIVGESSSTRLRTKSVSLARVSYFAVGLPLGYLTQYMVNPTAWNWQGKTAFFWTPFCALAWIWAYFRLPEFKGRSYWELDILFARKTPTKRFKDAIVEADADEHIRQQQDGEGVSLPAV